MDRNDVLIVLGVLLMGTGLWFLLAWPGVLVWVGFLLLIIGVAQARKKKA